MWVYVCMISFWRKIGCPGRLWPLLHHSHQRSFISNGIPSSGIPTGLNVLAKNRRNWHSISSIQASKSQKRDFRHFSGGKSALFKWKCQIREFHAHGMEQGEVLKRYCGWQKEATLLKQTSKDRPFCMQLVRYYRMHERVLKYQKTIPEKLSNK